MKKLQLNPILDFLEDWPTDESLSSPFINNIKNGRYVEGALHYLPNDNILFAEFWSEHIATYIHFYVYAMLQKWNSETSSEFVLQREKSYIHHFMDEIVEEMNSLLLHFENIKCTNNIIKEFLEHSTNVFFDVFKGSGFLLVTLCKNRGLEALSQKYYAFCVTHVEAMEPQIALMSLSDFLSTYSPNDYNNFLGRSVLKLIVNYLAEEYPRSDFQNISNNICNNTKKWEDTICLLKESVSNCLKYYNACIFSIDNITLGFTKFKDALAIREENNVKGDYSYSSCNIEYKGASISFEYDYDNEENGKCCGIHLYNGYSDKECKQALNYFLGILFNTPHFNSESLSYSDFLNYLEVHHFFELQRFHKNSKYSNSYSAQWRQVNNSHICDFIFSIDGEDGKDEKQIKDIKGISIQLNIYINDSDNQEELYKTIPPEQDSYDSGTNSSDYEFGLLKDNEPWFYVP